ncbi:MAG: DNA-binding protein [Chloroflexi bacterium]|nr:DNA-binding protein [Chloroflexota bacterium]MQC16649.1 DNA-binding protein [Chloroflexota bacterium]
MAATPLPKTSRPAQGALEEVGVHTLEDLAHWTERDVLALHGMGPKALRILREAMAERDLAFRSP